MDMKQKFGERMKQLRVSAGFSQEELSFKCDLDRTYINHVERGKRNLSLSSIEKICKGLNVSLTEFFNDERFNSI